MCNTEYIRRVIGVTRTFHWEITTGGVEIDLAGRDLRLVIVAAKGGEQVMDYTTDANVLTFVWQGTEQTRIDKYSVILWENYGEEDQRRVDIHNFVELVPWSAEQGGEYPDLTEETIELGTSDFTDRDNPYIVVVDSLTSHSAEAALSANMGRVLNNKVETKQDRLSHYGEESDIAAIVAGDASVIVSGLNDGAIVQQADELELTNISRTRRIGISADDDGVAVTVPSGEKLTYNGNEVATVPQLTQGLAGKQDTLVVGGNMDLLPRQDSQRPVSSGGVYDALAAKLSDAPSDGKIYGRKDGQWAETAGCGGGGGELDIVVGMDDIPVFSTSEAYDTTSIVLYEEKLYRFITPHAPGAWDESQVELTSLYLEVEKMMNDWSNETVVVTVEVNGNGFDPAGQKVICTLRNGTTTEYTIPASHTLSFSLPRGTMYSLTLSSVSGYICIAQSYTAQLQNRYVTLRYQVTTTDTGVFIMDKNGVPHDPLYWDTADNDDAVGVMLVTSDTLSRHYGIVIGKETYPPNLIWASYQENVVPGVSTDSSTDWSGFENTAAIKAFFDELPSYTSPMCDWVTTQSMTFGGTTYYGYVGAAQEVLAIATNSSAINSAMGLIGGAILQIMTEYWWTSTQREASRAFCVHNGTMDWSYKGGGMFRCCPLYKYSL